jgi:hypothetical protein
MIIEAERHARLFLLSHSLICRGFHLSQGTFSLGFGSFALSFRV